MNTFQNYKTYFIIYALLGALCICPILAQNPKAVLAYNFESNLEYGYEVLEGVAGNTKASQQGTDTNYLNHLIGPNNFGNGLDCSVSDNFFSVSDVSLSTLGDISNTDGLSISMWVKMPATTPSIFGRVCGLWNTIDALIQGQNLTMRFGPHSIGNPTGNPVFDGNWHHIVVSLDFTTGNNNHNYYMDGNLVTSQSVAVTEDFSVQYKPFVIGARGTSSGPYAGALDEVAIFSESLTSQNVTDLFQQGILLFCNQAPQIEMPEQYTVSIKQPTLDIFPIVTDDNLPVNNQLSYGWTQISGTAVSISNTETKDITVNFSQTGNYIMDLAVNDGAFTTTKRVSIKVVSNTAPIVDAGELIQLFHPETTGTLVGTLSDDDANNVLTIQWEVLYNGNNDIVISNPTSLTSSFSCNTPGSYTLQLTVEDSEYTIRDTVVIECLGSDYMSGNPVVNAGSSRITWLPNASLDLNAEVSNYSGASNYQWTKTLGIGNVTFSNPNNSSTNATFDQEGTYVLEFTVDGQYQDKMVVQVYAANDTFGYSQSERDTYFSGDLNLVYDFYNFDRERFTPPPSVGTHPRILFNKDELPDLRERLGIIQGNKTKAFGVNIYARILTRLNNDLYNISSLEGNLYKDLKVGIVSSFQSANNADRDKVVALMVYEAFRCLLEQDQVEGPKIATAFATVAGYAQQQINTVLPTTDYRIDIQEKIYRQYMGLAYDYLADPEVGFFNTSQRDIVRGLLSDSTTNMWNTGMDALPVYGANTSNWVTTHYMHLLFNTLAIEGETGYDPYLYPRIVATAERSMSLAVYENGATFEGMGKNALMVEAFVAMAKRGDYIGAVKSVKNHAKKFYLHSMIPQGNYFTFDEQLGGIQESRYVDIPAIKFMYPTDPTIDFVYRNDLQGDTYDRIGDFNTRFPYKAMDYMMRAIFAEDFNSSMSWVDQNASMDFNGLTYFDKHRGLLITRDTWNENAVQLYFQPRSVKGGHSADDRNTFSVNAHGRNWVRKFTGHELSGINQSTILVNGESGNSSPSSVVNFKELDAIVQVISDATASRRHGVLGNLTSNDLQFGESPEMWHNIPFEDEADWYTGQKEGFLVEPSKEFDHDYRTMSFIKGQLPFIIVADNIQKDENAHRYAWQLQFPKDVQLESTTVSLELDNYKYDMIMKPTTGNQRFLVRCLSNNGYIGTPATFDTTLTNSNRLIIESDSNNPYFKFLLFPYLDGQSLPLTTWNDTLDVVTVTINGEEIDITFIDNPMGATEVFLGDLSNDNTLAVESPEHTEFKLYPNPTTGTLFISGVENHKGWKIYDAAGRLVKSGNANEIDTSNFAQGFYFIHLSLSNATNVAKKFIRR